MIENLNKHAFAAFGRLLRDSQPGRGFPQDDGWRISVRSCCAANAVYQHCTREVYLDFESGMTVLAVRTPQEQHCFYLDKPVCLLPGVEFAVFPYQEECAVRMALPAGAALVDGDPFRSDAELRLTDRVKLGEVYTLFYREEESGFLFKGETHPMYELTYVDRGHLHCVVEGNGYELRQGQLMLFAPNQFHMQYTDLDITARFLTIAFDLESELELRLADRVFELSSREADFLRALLRELEINDPLSGDMIRCQLRLLLLCLLRDNGRRRKKLKTPVAQRNENLIVSRTLQYIATHVYDKMSVESVAREAGVSTSHLTALFHRQMDISPGEYIRRVKLEESKNLIREGRLNFSQIAAALNYSTIHHFSRQFKDNFGVSPSEYAKSIRTE